MFCLSSKRRGSLLFLIFFFSFSLLSSVPAVSAKGDSQLENVVVMAKTETVNHDYFGAGDTVTISGVVNGDAYVAGRSVIIEGTINGDLLAAGGQITIRGTVSQNVRAAAGEIVVSGSVGRNITAAAGTFTISDGATVLGNVVAGAGNISLLAPILKDVTVGAGTAMVGTAIGGNLTAGVNSLVLTPSASIGGTLQYWSDEQAQIATGATVSGGIVQKTIPKDPAPSTSEIAENKSAQTAMKAFGFLSAMLVGVLILGIFPAFSHRTAQTIIERPLQSLGLGFVLLIGIPAMCVFLMVTVIGIPLALIVFALYLKSLYLTKIFVSLTLGLFLLRQFDKKWHIVWTFIIGLMVFTMLTWVPFLGGLVSFVSLLLGLGSFVLEEHKTIVSLRKKEIL